MLYPWQDANEEKSLTEVEADWIAALAARIRTAAMLATTLHLQAVRDPEASAWSATPPGKVAGSAAEQLP